MMRIGKHSLDRDRITRTTGWWTLALVSIAFIWAPAAEAQDAGVVIERIAYPRPASLREISGEGSASTDAATGRRYSARVVVETDSQSGPVARFAVHVPDRSLLGIGRRSARFLAILWGLADRKFGALNARLKSGCADVWICRDGDAGGEQTRTSIYLYDALSSRTDLELARTIAHEYGHYLLPGPSGYVEPEPWANGLLGERLFTGWIRDELRSGRLTPEDTALLTLPSVEDYCSKQVDPLIQRVADAGPDTVRLGRKDKQGMDEAIALLLYADRVHGAQSLVGMLEWMRPRLGRQPAGADYLDAYTTWLDHSDAIVHRPLGGGSYRAYWPTGTFRVKQTSVGLIGIAVAQGHTLRSESGIGVRIPSPGWRSVKITPIGTMPDALTWVREQPPKRGRTSAAPS